MAPHPFRRLFVLLVVSAFALSPMLQSSDARAATPSVKVSASSGIVGDAITVSFRGFPKRLLVTATWDGTTVGQATASASGDGSLTVTVPKSPSGSHRVRVRSGETSASATFTVKPHLKPSARTVAVGQSVSVSLRGYRSGERITVSWDSTSARLATVTASATGTASATIVIPPTPGGDHALIGRGQGGGQFSARITVVPSLTVNPGVGGPGLNVRASLRGYEAGERVEIQWREGTTTRSLAILTASSTGSINTTVAIPASAKAGDHHIVGRGYGDSVAEAPFSVRR